MNIQEIGQTLLNELQTKLTTDQNNVKLAEGAIQGVQLFYNRLLAAETEALEGVSDGGSKDTKAVSKGKKAKK